MNKPTSIKSGQLMPHFRWRDRFGEFHRPTEMETRHLFFTLRMIWNHTCPEQFQIKPFQEYDFSDFYTTHYFKTAVLALSAELATRNDLEPYFIECLHYIHTTIKKGILK